MKQEESWPDSNAVLPTSASKLLQEPQKIICLVNEAVATDLLVT